MLIGRGAVEVYLRSGHGRIEGSRKDYSTSVEPEYFVLKYSQLRPFAPGYFVLKLSEVE